MICISRRSLVALGGATALSWSFPRIAGAQADSVAERVRAVGDRLGARIGFSMLDSADGSAVAVNADQRFPMCSTFKVVGTGAVLAMVDRGEADLSTPIVIEQSDMVEYAPKTETMIGQTMTLGEICEAALTLSDNVAGNKILETVGGPEALTEWARSIGDETFRLDRWETELNEATPGDERDTTTPAAMAETLRKLTSGDVLSDAGKAHLLTWMTANQTGDAKLRAGLPDDWSVGDKTGGGAYGTMADVAILERPDGSTISVAVYMTETEASFDDRNAGIAEIGKAIAEA